MPKTLLFIPDISGFTDFINKTEINHSKHIISELMESILSSNNIRLEICEIEGDAVFFFKNNDIPSLIEIIEQAKTMYLAFHSLINLYENRRICQCGACSSAVDLSIKFVAHIGDVQEIDIHGRKKLHGSDVILIHRLLKNNVNLKDYLLFTDSFKGAFSKLELNANYDWLKLENGQDDYENIGLIKYRYIPFAPLQEYVPQTPSFPVGSKIKKPFVKEVFINRPVEEVFEILINFDLRLKWNEGVDKLEYNKNEINRVGSKHVCVVNNKNIDFETVTNEFKEGQQVYGERLKGFPIVKELSTYYLLEKKGAGTQMTIELHCVPLSIPIIGQILAYLIKKQITKGIDKTTNAFKAVCEKMDEKTYVLEV